MILNLHLLPREIKDLSPEEKRALLAQLLRNKASQTQTKSEYALAYGQRALWFIHQLAPESSAYHIASTSRVRSLIDIDAFKRALQYLLDRHPALRTTYEQRDDQLVQVIHAHEDVAFEQIDASAWNEDELYEQVVRAHKQPIDLANGPVIRWQLFTKSPTDHVFLITVHHIASDGYSTFALLYDLKLAYDAEIAGQKPALPPLKATYTDYVDRQMSLLASEKGNQLKAYWLNQLSGELPILNLPLDFPRPLAQTYNGDSIKFTVDSEGTTRLKEFAMSEGVTLYVLLLSIFQTLLHRYSGQNDLLIGSPNSNRDMTEFSGTVGYFVDPVVLRSTIEAGTTFKSLLSQTRKTVIDAVAHQGYPFMLLVEQLVSLNDPSRSPLFQVMFNLQSLQRIETTSPLFQKDQTNPNTLLLEPFIMSYEEGQFDLNLDVVEVAGTLWCSLKYNTDLYEQSTITRMAGHFQTLIESILANPEAPISEMALLPEAERHQILVKWNDTHVDYPLDQCVHQLFEQQVNRTPHAVAVRFEDQTLTYDQLNRRANQLAHYLRRLGIGPDQKVGVYIERSLDLLVAMYAIHKAGGAYVPLDPAYPDDRVAFMLQDAQIAALLTQENLLQRLPQSLSPVICIARNWMTIAQESAENPVNTTSPANLCYMIYTSGSTGKPKGVMIEHRNVVNFFTGMDAHIPHDPPGVWLAVTSTSFDISVLELFWTLARGFTVILYADNPTQESFSDRSGAADYSIPALISRHHVTHMQCTPAMADMLLIAADSASALALLETMLVGGEALSVTLASQLRQRVRHTLLNVYGPTETTIWSSTFRVDTVAQTIPIGKPIANTTLYILDNHLRPVPIGVAGELYIGGAGVVRGYWNRPDLTAERFIPDPFSDQPGARLYKTGDLARYLPDGNIDFLGRNDFQVKIRGHRIELGEIETLLDQHPTIQKSVVIAREDTPGDKQLVAYIILQNTQAPTSSDFRAYLRDTLPEYMIPSAFVILDAFPLTPNRKVDRKGLPIPQQEYRTSQHPFVEPRTLLEKDVLAIWSDILDVKQISIYDDFFELGGHSLKATQVAGRIRDTFGVDLSIRLLLDYPTVAEVSQIVEAQLQSSSPVSAANRIIPRPHNDAIPPTFSQERLWVIAQMMDIGTAYNITINIRLRGILKLDVLQAALTEIVNRHEVLRTTFSYVDDQLSQHILETRPFHIAYSDLEAISIAYSDPDAISPSERSEQIEAWIRNEMNVVFDLKNGPLLQASLLRMSDDDFILALNIHHIVSDGWSLGVLLREFTSLYRAFENGQPSPLEALPIQYADFALWQRQHITEEALSDTISYWKNNLAGTLPILSLPTDRPRPAIQSFAGATHNFRVSKTVTSQLQTISRQEKSTLFMSLLAAFNALLWRYTHQDDVIIGTPIANRRHPEVEGLIGFFVNTLALRIDLSGDPTFVELVRRVREVALGAYAHQDMPFEKLIEISAVDRDLSFSPIFQVMFVLQNAPWEAIELPNLTIEPLNVDPQASKYDLTLYMREDMDELVAQFEYNADLFDAATIQHLENHFLTLLASAASHPTLTISQLTLLPEAERHQILVNWNDTRVDYPQDVWIHQLFERQVEKTPDAPAVIFEGQTLTYAQLNQRANQLAHYLGKIEKDTLIGVCMERSLEMVVSLYAVLKAGGAYVPMDPEYPPDRLSHMLSDSGVGLLLTQTHTADKLPEHRARVIRVDSEWPTIAQESTENLNVTLTGDNLAYMIYTSGSTGKPKGTLNTHKGVYNRLMWMQDAYGLTTDDAVMQKTPFSFDVSVWECFWPLMFGARLVVAQPGGHRDPAYLIGLINQQKITTLHFVPSMLAQFVNQRDVESCVSLRRVICSGEALPLDLQTRFFARLPSTELHNLYGPTEAAIDVTYWACDPNTSLRTVPIGRAIANTQIYLLDPQLQPVPIGIPGELHIGGVNLARGYHNRPELTAEKFIPNPFESGSRLYKTGDLVRWLPDGNIEYLGRIDHQVKIRGFRIELGEIEATLNEHGSVRESTVIVREDTEGDKRIVAYIVLNANEATVSSQELRDHLQESLPEYMIPSAFVILEMLPLSPNGKVDRKALPAPQREARPEIDVQNVPTRPMEILIADIWREVLEVNNISIYDNFFDLGGHSLQVMQVVTRLETKTGLKINPVIMRMQTLGQIALTFESQAAEPLAMPTATPAETKRPQNLLDSLRRFVTGKNDKG